MEFQGYLKTIILILALAVPLALFALFVRTLFSGLNSISKKRVSASDDAETQENTQDEQSSGRETK